MPVEQIPLIGPLLGAFGVHSEGWRSEPQLKADQQVRGDILNNLREATLAGRDDVVEGLRKAGREVGIPHSYFDGALDVARKNSAGAGVSAPLEQMLKALQGSGSGNNAATGGPTPAPTAPAASPLGNMPAPSPIREQNVTGQPTPTGYQPVAGQILGSLLAPQTAPAATTPLGQPAPAGSMRPQTAYPELPVQGQAPIGGKPILRNPDGSVSTERTITIESDGKHYVIPTIINGKAVTPDEAVQQWRAGRNQAVGVFNSAQEADQAAQTRSNSIGQFLQGQGVQTSGPTPASAAPPLSIQDRLAQQGLELGSSSYHPSQGWSLAVKDVGLAPKAYAAMVRDVGAGKDPMTALMDNAANMHQDAVKTMASDIWNTKFTKTYNDIVGLGLKGIPERDLRTMAAQWVADSGYPSNFAPKEIQEMLKRKVTDPLADHVVRNRLAAIVQQSNPAAASALMLGVKPRDAGIANAPQPPAGLTPEENKQRLMNPPGQPIVVQSAGGPMVVDRRSQQGLPMTGPGGQQILAPMSDVEAKPINEARVGTAHVNQLLDAAKAMLNERGQYSSRMRDLLFASSRGNTADEIVKNLSGVNNGMFNDKEKAFVNKMASIIANQNLGRMTEPDIMRRIRAWGGGTTGQNIVNQLESTRDVQAATHNVSVDTAASQGKGIANMQKLPMTSELNKAYAAAPQPRYGYTVVFSPTTQKYYYKAAAPQPTQ